MNSHAIHPSNALAMPIIQGNIREFVTLINEHGVEHLFEACVNGVTPAAYICRKNRMDFIKEAVLRISDNLDRLDARGASLLINASMNKSSNIVKFLLKNGANPNLLSRNNSSPLMFACWNGDQRTINALISYGADINYENHEGKTALGAACDTAHIGIAKQLAALGAKIGILEGAPKEIYEEIRSISDSVTLKKKVPARCAANTKNIGL